MMRVFHSKSIPFAALTVMMLIIGAPTSISANEEFPLRAKYPDVPYITISDLKKRFNAVAIVDVRSKYEFDTIHIKGAAHIPISGSEFQERMKALRGKTKNTIVVYCNGHSCAKSYDSVRKSKNYGISDVVAFDAGIFEWTRTYPKQAVMLGRSPVNPKNLISKKDFKKRLLKPARFQRMTDSGNVLVLDVRSRLQRAGSGLFPFTEKHASLDDKARLNQLITMAKQQGKTLLVYDAVGKQTRWFEYHLRKRGVRKYYFMEGGADAYMKLLAQQQNAPVIPSLSSKSAKKK